MIFLIFLKKNYILFSHLNAGNIFETVLLKGGHVYYYKVFVVANRTLNHCCSQAETYSTKYATESNSYTNLTAFGKSCSDNQGYIFIFGGVNTLSALVPSL